MSQSLIIKNGKFTARLYEVSSLLVLPLANIRKLWKLMFDEAWSNAETIATIEDWLPQAQLEEASRQLRLEGEAITARQEAEAKRQYVEALGSSLDMSIKQAKQRLQQAKQPADKLSARAALCNAMLPKTEYRQATQTVKALEIEIKKAMRNQDRLEKLQTIFNEMRR
ncbi:hypothetical protein LJC74_03230 [Eubacteriales bacterium OttesenSCG-928-A19]|nr:hypothetical protein [Eubacteriales bacterium OttesenSCG-928-A19]